MNKKSATLSFTKMQGAGNDFIIIDNREQMLSKETIVSRASELCDRRFGIGADGIITLQPTSQDNLNYEMFYRNADGSDAGMCGNGARCLARFASEIGLGDNLSFSVHDVTYKAEIDTTSNNVTIHFLMEIEVEKVTPDAPENPLFKVYTGTEHIVQQVDKDTLEDEALLFREGRRLRNHPDFSPPGTNVNFICGTGPQSLRIQTYERGVENLTLACGTGTIAGALTWHHISKDIVDEPLKYQVRAEGGTLEVGFVYNSNHKKYTHIKLSGEAQFVFEGTWHY